MKTKAAVFFFMFLLPLSIAAVSFFGLSRVATSASTHQKSIEALEEKRDSVLQLTSASTAASVALTVLPGDIATPIATKLTDISGYFLLVLCAIYVEKFLLILTGFATFKVIIPLACIFWMLSIFRKPKLRNTAVKLLLFGIAIFALVPCSLMVTGMIEDVYGSSVQEAITEADVVADQGDLAAAASTELGDNSTAGGANGAAVVDNSAAGANGAAATGKKGFGSFFSWVRDKVSDTRTTIEDAVEETRDNLNEFVESKTVSVEEKVEQAKVLLNDFIDALALMIVTSCIVPILVLVFFAWIIKMFFGLEFSSPSLSFLEDKSEAQ